MVEAWAVVSADPGVAAGADVVALGELGEPAVAVVEAEAEGDAVAVEVALPDMLALSGS